MSLTAALVVFLSGTTIKTLIGCKAFAVLLHYFILTSFSWMAVEGFNLYIYFVKVMIRQVPGFFWKANIFAWGKAYCMIICSLHAFSFQSQIYLKVCALSQESLPEESICLRLQRRHRSEIWSKQCSFLSVFSNKNENVPPVIHQQKCLVNGICGNFDIKSDYIDRLIP